MTPEMIAMATMSTRAMTTKPPSTIITVLRIPNQSVALPQLQPTTNTLATRMSNTSALFRQLVMEPSSSVINYH